MPGAPDRLTRVNALLKREIGSYIERSMIAPSASMLISVTEVRSSVDLRAATVSISVFGASRSEKNNVLELMTKERKALQAHLGRVLGFKHTPVLTFRIDHRLEAGDRVLKILNDLENQEDQPNHDAK